MCMDKILLVWSALQAVFGLLEQELEQFKALENYTEKYSNANPYVNISIVDTDALLVTFNAIPAHYTGQFDGQSTSKPQIREQDLSFKIKLNPDKASDVLWCLPFGIIGITIGGVPIYNPYVPEPGCKYAKDELYLDACNGRTDEDGVYHYYGYSPCVQMFSCDSPASIYGVAIDGYPIYGPYDEEGQLVTSSDLDECGGRLDDYGNYKYHLTVDQPNVLWCLKGSLSTDIGLNIDNFVCNCPYTDSHFEKKHILPICNETDSGNSTDNSTIEDTTNDRRRRQNEMNNLNSENNATGNSTSKNDTENATNKPKRKDCITQKEFDSMYSMTLWGGKNTTAPAVCNFTNPYSIVLCEINQTALWDKRPSWEYVEKVVDMLPCCPKEQHCNGSCWLDKTEDTETHLNPDCNVDQLQINYKKRIMIPNCSSKPSYLWTPLIIFLLPFIRPNIN